MKNIFLVVVSVLFTALSFAQFEKNDVITMISDYSSDNTEIRDILQFEGIEYLKLTFKGKDLTDKTYHLTVKEIWDGVVKTDTTIMNSAEIGIKQFEKINDTVFNIKIISKLTADNKLKMTFKFPRFSVNRKFDAINSDDYSLRNIAEANESEI